MAELTKEWLLRTIAELEEERDAVPGAVNEDAVMALEAMKRALASLEAEAVAYMIGGHYLMHAQDPKVDNYTSAVPLYTSPPMPVSVPDDVMAAIQKVARIRLDLNEFDGDRRGIAESLGEAEEALIEVVNRRAAMLRSEPVTTANKLPETQFKQVADLYEMQFDDGRTCAFHTDAEKAVQWLNTCDGNKVQEYVKLERLHDAFSGNSPVIPDGWVACSERMPEKADEVLCAKEFDGPGDWRQKVGYYLAGKWTVYSASWTPTHWMPLPAAPQQEVK